MTIFNWNEQSFFHSQGGKSKAATLLLLVNGL